MKTQTLEPAEPATFYSPSAEETVARTSAAIHLRNILVPLDFSELAEKALEYAVPFAAQFGAKITLLHVVEPPVYTPELPYPSSLATESQMEYEKRLQATRAARIPEGIPVDIAVRYNFVFDGILEVAREIQADLIVTTTHGFTGLKHLLMGSTAENIVRRAPCPVLVVREREHDFV